MVQTSLANLREEMRGVARGERRATPLPAAPLLATLSREALELLSIVLQERPTSIAEISSLTGRAQPNVSRSLQQLAGHGLIRLVRDGREVRPEPVARELRVDLMTGTLVVIPLVAGSPAA